MILSSSERFGTGIVCMGSSLKQRKQQIFITVTEIIFSVYYTLPGPTSGLYSLHKIEALTKEIIIEKKEVKTKKKKKKKKKRQQITFK